MIYDDDDPYTISDQLPRLDIWTKEHRGLCLHHLEKTFTDELRGRSTKTQPKKELPEVFESSIVKK